MTDDLDELERRVTSCGTFTDEQWRKQTAYGVANGEVLALISRCRTAEAAVAGLLSNKHINLGDMIYHVREVEGLGWEGPSVTAWNHAVQEAERVLKAKAERTRGDT
jgi:hypothetical protein